MNPPEAQGNNIEHIVEMRLLVPRRFYATGERRCAACGEFYLDTYDHVRRKITPDHEAVKRIILKKMGEKDE